jgi:hypothetical protein
MDVRVRTMLIIGEVLFLTVLMSCLLGGLWLTVFDLGLKPKYRRAVVMALVAVGCLAVAFFVAHLISFYPT